MNTTVHARKSYETLPKAIIHRSHFSWLYWLVPLGAAGVCAWFIYRDVIAGGPIITICFRNADGLQEKNTRVKFRGADVGEVKSLQLAKNHELAKVTVRLAGSAQMLARQGSIFWIVRPELRGGSVSGLGTIVSGEYIGVQPGAGAATNSFMGAEKEPITQQPGELQIILRSASLDSLQELSPIFYRGIQVGEVLYFQLSDDARDVTIHARIQKSYAALVRQDTKFWNAGGINVRLGLFKGVQISAESPQTVLSGGIEFATPPELQNQASNGTTFLLYEKPEDKWKTWAPEIKLNLPEKAIQSDATRELHLK